MVQTFAPPHQRRQLIQLADDLRRCLERWDAACRERHQQQMRYGVSGSAAALAAEWEAMADACECRQAIADLGCLILRLAADLNPVAVRAILADMVIDVMADELPAAVRALAVKGACE